MSDYDLKAVLKRIKTKPFNFALIKGSESNQVYLSPKPPAAKHLEPTMEECGDGKRIAKGLCKWENDQLTFATKAAPSGAWEKMTTKIFKDNQCAKYLPVVFRQLGEDESDEVSIEEGEIKGEAETEAQTGTAAPSQSGVSPGADLAAQWKQLKLALYPEIKARLEENPPNRDDILKLVGEATRHEKAANFGAAIEEFQQLRPLLQGAPLAPPPPPPSTDLMGLFTKRLQAMMPQIKEAIAAAGPAAQDIKLKASEAGVFAKKKDFAQANRLLDEVNVLLDANGAPTASSVGKKVAFAQAKIRWNQAKDTVKMQLDQLHKTILEEFNDEESAASAKKLNKVLARFNEGLGDALDELYNATKDRKAALRDQVRTRAATYLEYVQKDPLVVHVERNPFMSVTVQKTLARPLVDLKALLAG